MMKLLACNSLSLVRLALAWLAVTALMAPAWAAVGYVHSVTGSAFMRQGSAPERAIAVGQTFDPGATFRTGANSTLVLKFEDGQLTTLRPESSFRVDQFSFNPKNPSAGNSAIALLTGAMRFVTGLVGSTNRSNVRIAAGTATIGIRGTDIVFDTNGNAFVLVGGIDLSGQGTQPILIPVGNFASLSGQTGPITGAPGLFRASADQLAGIVQPNNTPTPLSTAVAAAVAKADAASKQATAAAAAKLAQTAAADPNSTAVQRAEAADRAARAAAEAAAAAADAASKEATAARTALNVLTAAVNAGAKPAVSVAPAGTASAATTAAQQRAATDQAILDAVRAAANAADTASSAANAAKTQAETQANLAKELAAGVITTKSDSEQSRLNANKALAAAGFATASAAVAITQSAIATAETSNLSTAAKTAIASDASRAASNSNIAAAAATNAQNAQSASQANQAANAATTIAAGNMALSESSSTTVERDTTTTNTGTGGTTSATTSQTVVCLPSPC